jgi:hypothetical protein
VEKRTFLLAAGERLRGLGAACVDGELLSGAELHEHSAREALAEVAASGITANVTVSDFFDVDLSVGSFDAIVSNPPCVRYPGVPRRAAGQGAGGRPEGRRAPDRPGELLGLTPVRIMTRSPCEVCEPPVQPGPIEIRLALEIAIDVVRHLEGWSVLRTQPSKVWGSDPGRIRAPGAATGRRCSGPFASGNVFPIHSAR